MHLVDWIETDEFYFQSFWMMRVESKNSSKEKFGQEYYWDFLKKDFAIWSLFKVVWLWR
jgi:hypothetical protein